MSSRYNLRRPRAASPPAPTAGNPGESFSTANENADNHAGSSPLSSASIPESPRLGAERRADLTYSQVAASRPPTPSRDERLETVSSKNENIFTQDKSLESDVAAEGAAGRRRVTMEEVTDEEEGGPWITVQRRRRTRSTGSMPNAYEASPRQHPRLSTAQQETVRRAEEMLAPAERERIARRMDASQGARRRADSESSDSLGEGPSDPMRKGKAVDARNWGAVGIPDEELDPEAQRRELDMYSLDRAYRNDTVDPTTQRAEPRHETNTAERANSLAERMTQRVEELQRELDAVRAQASAAAVPTATKKKEKSPLGLSKLEVRRTKKARQPSLRPVAQLEPGSYLGRAFEDLVGGGDPGDFSSSSSSSDSSSDAGPRPPRRAGTPIDDGNSSESSEKPEPYDGRPDAQVFHKFMRQTIEYL